LRKNTASALKIPMVNPMTIDLKEINEVFLRELSSDISVYDESFLIKSIERRMTETGCSSFRSYISYINENSHEAAQLIDSLSINFSEFFRNPVTFAFLEQTILPQIFEKKKKNNEKEVRIWSAACASGQEAYSLAILCDELIEYHKYKITCRIFATDYNKAVLVEAQKGIYRKETVSRVTLKRINDYFIRQGDNYLLKPEIKKYIDFSVYDLVNSTESCPPSSIYGNFDLVFCSNILFYYNPEIRSRIISIAGSCMEKNGFFITGETEREFLLSHNYSEYMQQSAIFQRNQNWSNKP